jgi:hypothetical protein
MRTVRTLVKLALLSALFIAIGALAQTVTSPLTATATVGTAFSYQISVSGTATGYAATGLPAGLTYTAATGLISGMPTASGTYAVVLGVNLSGGQYIRATLALTVNPAGGGPTPPPATTLLCATDPNPACGVVLSWKAPPGAASAALAVTGYQVFRSVGSSGSPTQLTTTPLTAATYTDKTIAPSTTYVYYVVSVDAAGTQSAPSNTVNVAVASGPSVPTPATPANLTGSVVN